MNFGTFEVLELISKTQVNLENNILIDHDRVLVVLKHYMLHMFTGQFFKEKQNFIILEVLKILLRVQVYFENNILMYYDRE